MSISVKCFCEVNAQCHLGRRSKRTKQKEMLRHGKEKNSKRERKRESKKKDTAEHANDTR